LGRDFFNALSEKDADRFTQMLFKWLGAVVLGVPVYVFREYFQVLPFQILLGRMLAQRAAFVGLRTNYQQIGCMWSCACNAALMGQLQFRFDQCLGANPLEFCSDPK